MTSKDIRDITAYWGFACSYELSRQHYMNCYGQIHDLTRPQGFDKINGVVGFETIKNISARHFTQNFKLHLRRIFSLTDEEIRTVCGLVDESVPETINRENGIIQAGNVRINTHSGEISTRKYISLYTAPAYAYLQSVGVYVPGTINEAFVQLI